MSRAQLQKAEDILDQLLARALSVSKSHLYTQAKQSAIKEDRRHTNYADEEYYNYVLVLLE